MASQGEVKSDKDILVKKQMNLKYTFEPTDEKERDELLESSDVTAKKLEFKDIENANLK